MGEAERKSSSQPVVSFREAKPSLSSHSLASHNGTRRASQSNSTAVENALAGIGLAQLKQPALIGTSVFEVDAQQANLLSPFHPLSSPIDSSVASSPHHDAVQSCTTCPCGRQRCRRKVSSPHRPCLQELALVLTVCRTAMPQVAGYATLREIEGRMCRMNGSSNV
jgi:hypothetical protein